MLKLYKRKFNSEQYFRWGDPFRPNLWKNLSRKAGNLYFLAKKCNPSKNSRNLILKCWNSLKNAETSIRYRIFLERTPWISQKNPCVSVVYCSSRWILLGTWFDDGFGFFIARNPILVQCELKNSLRETKLFHKIYNVIMQVQSTKSHTNHTLLSPKFSPKKFSQGVS